MAVKSVRNPRRNVPGADARGTDLLLESQDLLNSFTVGYWSPPVDICQTATRVVVRIELPGVDASDVSVRYKGAQLRIRGIKREQQRKLLCYYCLERRYGRFDRLISIQGVVNPKKSNASLQGGILTIELAKVEDRRGSDIDIPIKPK